MKRSTAYPERRSHGEFKLNCQLKYSQIENDKHKKKINPIFLQDNYGIKKEVKDEYILSNNHNSISNNSNN